jgi:excisionase family DNA binding protein
MRSVWFIWRFRVLFERSCRNSSLKATTMQNGQNFSSLIPKKIAANRLGISVRTLERQIEAGNGPALVRIGSRVLIPEDALVIWIQARTVQPKAA